MKKIITTIALSINLMAVTVPEATYAYGRLSTSVAAFIAATQSMMATQVAVNDGLKSQLSNTEAMMVSTTYQTQQLKMLAGTLSSYVDIKAALINIDGLQNETDLAYSKILDGEATKIEILRLKSEGF